MEIDLDPIKKKYPDVEWSIEFLGDKENIRSIVGKRKGFYLAWVIPPHKFYKLEGRPWATRAAYHITKKLRDEEKKKLLGLS